MECDTSPPPLPAAQNAPENAGQRENCAPQAEFLPSVKVPWWIQAKGVEEMYICFWSFSSLVAEVIC